MRGKIGNIGKRKLLQTVLAGAACLSLIAALFLMPGTLAQGASTRLDWNKQNGGCSITIKPGDLDGIKEAEITIDLYQVATAVRSSVYDTYSYSLSEGFEDLEKELSEDTRLTNDDWRKLSQRAARIALGYTENGITTESTASTVKPTATKNVGIGDEYVKFDNIDFGLYLVIARDSNDDSPASYSKVKESEGEDEEEGTSSLVTMAYSDTKVYTFLPELISMPSTVKELSEGLEEGPNRTDTGEWRYDITAVLKPEQELLYGKLDIVKTLTSYQEEEPVVFIYQIDVYDEKDGSLIDSGSASIVFDKPGRETYPVSGMKFPAGSYVVVTEVYSGPSYTAENTVWEGSIPKGKTGIETPAEAAFKNEYDKRVNGGGYIINRFTYETDGSWHLTQIYDTNVAGNTPGGTEGETGEETETPAGDNQSNETEKNP